MYIMAKKDKAIIAGLRSIKLETEPGTYFWCACGRSSGQPFCDGSHQGTDFQPLPVTLPFCDHTHRELPGYSKE
jgi:CDGSH iron-sulfur domain-containing protein 3